MDAQWPVPPLGRVRVRGYNLDYVLVGALGWAVPGILLRRHSATEQDRQSARTVGRRVQLPIEDEAAAMHFAMAFWDLMRLATLAVWVASLVVLAVDRRLFDGPFLTVSLVIAGAMFASAVGYFITFLHRSKLAETDESWVDGDGRQHLVRFGTPKPYDALIVLGTGILTVAVGLNLT